MRNLSVENAVTDIIEAVDRYINGMTINLLPVSSVRKQLASHFSSNGGSVKIASVFFLAYSLQDDSWDKKTIPVGTRGKFGDKRLSAELTNRYVTFHNNITAFGENLGTKGNVRNFDLSNDPRFSSFIKLLELSIADRVKIFEYLCCVIADSRVVPKALPKLPANYLTYARSVALFDQLLSVKSEGHIQQFIVASILFLHRRRYGIEIITHHPHASDKFDDTYGDIEEFHNNNLINAYEVTIRDDWKNRIPDLRNKLHNSGLQKYVLIASNISNDKQLSSPKSLIEFSEKTGFDLAIVDLHEFIRVFCAELSSNEIREVLNKCYEYLLDQKLCGRNDIVVSYASIINEWIDS